MKRDETWFEQLTLPAGALTIDAYGDGAKPKIDGSRAVGTWTSLGGNLYSVTITLSSGEGLGNVSEDGVLMTFAAWNTNPATTFASAIDGSYSYDYVTSTVYIKRTADPTLHTYRASVRFFGITAEDKSDVAIKNVTIARFSLHGVNLKNCARCSVIDSSILDGGGAYIMANPSTPPDYIYAGNGIEFGNSSSYGVVESVTVSNIFDSCITPQTFSSGQTASQFTFSNLTLEKCGFAGIEVSVLSNGGTTGSSISNVVVSDATISNCGKGFSGRRYGTEGHGIRLIADAGAGTMSSLSVENTQITGSAGDGLKIAGQIGTVTLNRLKLKGNNYGVNVTDASSTNLKLLLKSSLIYGNANYGVVFNAPTAAGFNLFHNTFYNNTTINFGVFNQAGEALLKNNLFYSSAAMTHFYVASTLTGASVNNNCYNNTANMFSYNGTAYSTVAAYNAGTAFEANGIGGTVGLTDPAGENFALLSSSNCRGLGNSSVGVTTDYSGDAFASPPSSGAYEYP